MSLFGEVFIPAIDALQSFLERGGSLTANLVEDLGNLKKVAERLDVLIDEHPYLALVTLGVAAFATVAFAPEIAALDLVVFAIASGFRGFRGHLPDCSKLHAKPP
jgi:hypothetical protein